MARKRFNIYAGIEPEQYNLHIIEDAYHKTVEDAQEHAKLFAEDLYCLNPKRDVLEIMELDHVEEEVAFSTFVAEMYDNTVYYIEELVEINGEVIETIRHECR